MRYTLKCLTCGYHTTTRTALGQSDYQEFAFPCSGCGVEIRYGMKLLLRKRMGRLTKGKTKAQIKEVMRSLATKPQVRYVNLVNAKFGNEAKSSETISLDANSLIPNTPRDFSPFMAMVELLPGNRFPRFDSNQNTRRLAVEKFYPEIERLITHFDRRQWALFDKQFEALELNLPVKTEADRIKAIFAATELATMFFFSGGEHARQRIRQRIALAETQAPSLTKDLIAYFEKSQKDESIVRELWAIRSRWMNCHAALAPVFISLYWDDKLHSLDSFTVAQKRFDDLKPLYVDCFETLCRISVIAAGLEGIIFKNVVGVPKAAGALSLAEFDVMANGSKPDLLKGLVIGDIFAPFIDHNLRNGIGHHSAHYDVKKDSIQYTTDNRKGRKKFEILYVRFCEQLVRLYGQLELVSTYAHWLRQAALRVL